MGNVFKLKGDYSIVAVYPFALFLFVCSAYLFYDDY